MQRGSARNGNERNKVDIGSRQRTAARQCKREKLEKQKFTKSFKATQRSAAQRTSARERHQRNKVEEEFQGNATRPREKEK